MSDEPRSAGRRPGGDVVVEVQQVVDVRDQRRRVPRADRQQHLAAGQQQLVAQLQFLGEIRLTVQADTR